MKNISDFKDKIICGNSLEVLKDIPEDSINLVITSPPYFGCRVYGDETLGREENPLDYVSNLFEFMTEIKRVLHPNGSFYLNLGDVYFGTKGFSRNEGKFKRKTDGHYKEHKIAKEDGKYLQYKQLLLLPSRLAIKMQDDGWLLRNQVIWNKVNPLPSYSKDRRLPVYEYFFHFAKSKKYFFDYNKAKDMGHHRDIISHGIEAFGDHHATFPESLVEPFILTTSRENDIVLDPFCGAGTVPVVCKKNKRHYIGIELAEKNCIISENRLNETNLNENSKNDPLTLFNI